jgi:hypothetical protein
MKLQDTKFLEWATTMWHKNCVERDGFGDAVHTFDDYVENNLDFLKEKYREDCFERSQARDAWVQTIRESSPS